MSFASLGRAVAQVSDSGPRTTFLFARFAIHGARALYAGYGAGSWQGVLGLVEEPNTGYWETLAGVAKGFNLTSRQSLTVALTVADASDSHYVQIYLVPAFAVGRLVLTGTTVIYLPLQSQGAYQYYVSPLSLHFTTDSPLQIGISYDMAGKEGVATGHALGPSFKVAVPHGSVTVDQLLAIAAYRTQTRVSFQTTL